MKITMMSDFRLHLLAGMLPKVLKLKIKMTVIDPSFHNACLIGHHETTLHCWDAPSGPQPVYERFMTVSAMHGCTRYPGTLVPFLLVHGVDIAYVVEILRIPCSHTMHTYYIGHTSILQIKNMTTATM